MDVTVHPNASEAAIPSFESVATQGKAVSTRYAIDREMAKVYFRLMLNKPALVLAPLNAPGSLRSTRNSLLLDPMLLSLSSLTLNGNSTALLPKALHHLGTE
jgi:hypothetical protein